MPSLRLRRSTVQSPTSTTSSGTPIPSLEKDLIPGYDYDLPNYQCPVNEPPERVQFGDAFPVYLWNLILASIVVYTIVPCFMEYMTGSAQSLITDIHGNVIEYYHPLLAGFLVCYYIFSLTIRFIETDAHVFYEQCWACNYVMLVSAYGMYTSNPILTGLSCVIVAVDQMCWYLDLLCFVLFGKYHIGVAKYLSNPDISFAKKLTAWHHIWFLPLMLYTVHWKLPLYSFMLGSIMASTTSLIARTSIPFYCLSANKYPLDQNKKYTPPQPKMKYKVIYLNVNCPYAFWEDIPFEFLHWFNHRVWYLYLPYLFLIANCILNLPAVLIMHSILMPINGQWGFSQFC
jgi:hypothetical protein